MTDLDYEPYDPAAEAFAAKLEMLTPPLGGYLAWLWQQGLINRGDRNTRVDAGANDRGHDELVDEFAAVHPEWAEYADEIMQMSEHLDRTGMMLTDGTRLDAPGPDPFDHALFVEEFFADQAVCEAERRAEQCCRRC